MCNCIHETNDALAKQTENTKLDVPIMFDTQAGILSANRVTISTAKRDDHSRKNPVRMFASYCPFCGEKYPEKDGVENGSPER